MNYCSTDENRNSPSVLGEAAKRQRKKRVSSSKADHHKPNTMDSKRTCHEGLRKTRRNTVLLPLNTDMRYWRTREWFNYDVPRILSQGLELLLLLNRNQRIFFLFIVLKWEKTVLRKSGKKYFNDSLRIVFAAKQRSATIFCKWIV